MIRKNIGVVLLLVTVVCLITFTFLSAKAQQDAWHTEQLKHADNAYRKTMRYFYEHNYTVIRASYQHFDHIVLIHKTSEIIELADKFDVSVIFDQFYRSGSEWDTYIWFIHNGTIYRYEYPLR